MLLAVVRCPACRGASRVEPDAIGQMVACPRCEAPFVAEEDIPIVQPLARPPVTRAGAARRAAAVPVAPPRRRSAFAEEPPASTSDTAEKPKIPDPEHDPHLPPPAGLPVSVLVGLALLPFGIPLLWWVAPLLTGQEAALSLAVPVCLAIAAAALCLGVVYTIDWTAPTRIKGVLMLVGLSYLSAAGLYFLKKDMMDRVRAIGGDPNQWTYVSMREGRVKMPGHAAEDKRQPLEGVVQMADGRRATYVTDLQDGPTYDYLFAVSQEHPAAKKPDDAWFARIGDKLKPAGGKLVGEPEALKYGDEPGRQWTFDLGAGRAKRVVQVYAINGRVYYLSAEGPDLTPKDEDFGRPFFDSFFVNIKP